MRRIRPIGSSDRLGGCDGGAVILIADIGAPAAMTRQEARSPAIPTFGPLFTGLSEIDSARMRVWYRPKPKPARHALLHLARLQISRHPPRAGCSIGFSQTRHRVRKKLE
jgi:hypothetical protein